jgi:hypothetical protein
VVNVRLDMENGRIHEKKFKKSFIMVNELILGHKPLKEKIGLGLAK